MMKSTISHCLLACACSSLMFGAVSAQPATPEPVAVNVVEPFSQPVALEALASMRGASDQVSAQIKLIGTTAGNTAEHVITGNNAINAGSFANMNGIPLVVQNTGANVLIQNAVILQLQLQ